MDDRVLRGFVRQFLLTEEIVTIVRGKDSTLYNAEFDSSGNILSARPHEVPPEDLSLVEEIGKHTSAPSAAIYKTIMELAELTDPDDPEARWEQLAGPWRGPEDIVAVVNDLRSKSPAFKSALLWDPLNRKGRGEAALKLVFKFSDVDEPDFVSEGGSVKLSVKYFGDGSGTVKSGSGGVSKTAEILSRLRVILRKNDFGSNYKGSDLLGDLNKLSDPERRAEAIEKCSEIFDEVKFDLAIDHGAQGIFGHDSSGAYYISPENASRDLALVAIRDNGTRAEFHGPNVSSSRMTLEKVLDLARRGEIDVPGSRAAREKAKAATKTPPGPKGVKSKRTT